jgi:prolyl-tRNA editing enzyme YbaK/EbsC (Cys-tRNA(Pro) deacylase)
MTSELPPACQRVFNAAHAAGLEIDIKIFPEGAHTAEAAAAAIGCDVAQIVKSLIFRGKDSGQTILLLVSGKNRVNEKFVRDQIGEALERADADAVRAATGFAIGGIPPLGHASVLPVLMDEDLLAFDEIWAAAGIPPSVFKVRPQELLRATGAKVFNPNARVAA